MAKRFLSRELIISTAYRMIDEKGMDSFSVRQVAVVLGVQVSSLYNHIDNEYDLLLSVAKKVTETYTEFIAKELNGVPQQEIAYKAGDAFRVFVNKHRWLYELLLDRRWIGTPEFEKVIEKFTEPIYDLMPDEIKKKSEKDHIYVAMRVVTHGFLSLESLGVFDGLSVDITESYHMMIKSVMDMMNKLCENS